MSSAEPAGGKSDRLTHIDSTGDARMVDVTAKPVSARQARATGFVEVSPKVVELLRGDSQPFFYTLAYLGHADVTADTITSERIAETTDRELLEKYSGGEKPKSKPPERRERLDRASLIDPVCESPTRCQMNQRRQLMTADPRDHHLPDGGLLRRHFGHSVTLTRLADLRG